MRWRTLVGPLIGVLTAGVAIGVGEFAAVFVRPAAAPVLAVGNRVVLLTPEAVKRVVIRNFGTSDKSFLLTTLFILIAAFGVLLGRAALRNIWFGVAGVLAFGAFGIYCALTDHAAKGTDAVPAVVATVAGLATLWLLVRTLGTVDDAPITHLSADRRRFLVGSAGAAGLAAIAGFGGRSAIRARFDVAAKRSAIRLPAASEQIPTIARTVDLGRSGVPFVTPSADFYRIDTALDIPQVDPASWSLRIHGMVDHEITLTYAELQRRPLIERFITMCCVSNPVGGNLISTGRFLGVRFADVLREAGVHSGSDQLLMTSVDGMTIGAPTKVVMDGRDALIAIGLNGEPLPVAHGFPARIVVPGLYGYVSACKWVTDIEATTFAAHRAYWIEGGWAQDDGIQLESRIDTPRSGARLAVGRPVSIAGVAWDQHVGVSKVEVQIDDGPWLTARLAAVPSTDTWRQWVVPWTPPRAGSYTVRVRATDATGHTQTPNRVDVFPAGATGWHSIVVRAA